ncbi:MAG TPA: redoxin domain-containing protein [Nonomuraea sp.]|nr:redoxin domain-containing protein [Nonomuraea sp.]
MLTVRASAALAAAALLAAACAGPEQETGPQSAAQTASPATSSAPAAPSEPSGSGRPGGAAVPEALTFAARTLDGRSFRGDSLAGKPVVFWFWAPWCPKCLSDAPHVKAAAAAHADVAFVGVAGLDTEAAMKEFVQRTGTGSLTHLSDERGEVWTRLGVSQQSTFVFMRPDGSTEKASGPLGKEQLDGHVRALLSG